MEAVSKIHLHVKFRYYFKQFKETYRIHSKMILKWCVISIKVF